MNLQNQLHKRTGILIPLPPVEALCCSIPTFSYPLSLCRVQTPPAVSLYATAFQPESEHAESASPGSPMLI